MANRQRIAEVGKYLEKYYVPEDFGKKAEQEIWPHFFGRAANILEEKEQASDRMPVLPKKDGDAGLKTAAFRTLASPCERTGKTAAPCASAMMPCRRQLDDLFDQMDETFSRKLLCMIKERGMKERDAYKKAYIDRRHFSKIKKNADYVPNKKTVLAFSIALELNLDETKDLLRSAGYALSRSSKFDIIVVYFLEQKIYDMFEINDVLYAYEQSVFE